MSDEVTKQQLAEHDRRLAVVETKMGVMDHKIDEAVKTIKENNITANAIGKQVAALQARLEGSARSLSVGMGMLALVIPVLVYALDALLR